VQQDQASALSVQHAGRQYQRPDAGHIGEAQSRHVNRQLMCFPGELPVISALSCPVVVRSASRFSDLPTWRARLCMP
jgi:hypothetical protein